MNPLISVAKRAIVSHCRQHLTGEPIFREGIAVEGQNMVFFWCVCCS
jgi:hypothetical protein